MPLLTIPAVTKGTPATITLDKTTLFAISAVAADDYFSVESNVDKCIIEYRSSPGKQTHRLLFDLSEPSPTASILVSAKGRSSFVISKIILVDFDEDTLSVPSAQIPSGLGVSVSAPPSPGVYPGRDGYVSLLLDMEGASIVDRSLSANALTISGYTTSTEQFKYGARSAKSDQFSGSRIEAPTSVGEVGSADFTIEGWFYQTSQSGFQGLWSKPNANGNYNLSFGLYTSGNELLFLLGDGAGWTLGYNFLPLNSWTHLAIGRRSGKLMFYLNGVAYLNGGYGLNYPAAVPTSSSGFYVGAFTGSPFKGYIDDFRISLGVERYWGNQERAPGFTPPGAFSTY